jgi:hypothetical protein
MIEVFKRSGAHLLRLIRTPYFDCVTELRITLGYVCRAYLVKRRITAQEVIAQESQKEGKDVWGVPFAATATFSWINRNGGMQLFSYNIQSKELTLNCDTLSPQRRADNEPTYLVWGGHSCPPSQS